MDYILFLILILVCIAAYLWGQRGGQARSAHTLDDSQGQAMTALQAQLELLANCCPSQAQMAEQLRQQEAQLSKRLQEQLGSMSEHMSQNLQKQTQNTHENLTSLAERLAVIDAASQQITTLTSHVTSLQNILSNKTERGAFGEVQLENLVRTVLPPNAYEFQHQLSNGKRADCVLRLPNPLGILSLMRNFRSKHGKPYKTRQMRWPNRRHVKRLAWPSKVM